MDDPSISQNIKDNIEITVDLQKMSLIKLKLMLKEMILELKKSKRLENKWLQKIKKIASKGLIKMC